MKRKILFAAALTMGSVLVTSVPADARGIPANAGCGKLFGSLVSGEAQAGNLGGPSVGPASHMGLAGVKGLLCGSG